MEKKNRNLSLPESLESGDLIKYSVKPLSGKALTAELGDQNQGEKVWLMVQSPLPHPYHRKVDQKFVTPIVISYQKSKSYNSGCTWYRLVVPCKHTKSCMMDQLSA